MQDQLDTIYQDVHHAYRTIDTILGATSAATFGMGLTPISQELAQGHQSRLKTLEADLRNLELTWQPQPDQDATYIRQVVFPFLQSILESRYASLELWRSGHFLASDERYDLSLKADAIDPHDVVDIEEKMHMAIADFVDRQKRVPYDLMPLVESESPGTYKDQCIAIKVALDRAASKLFGRVITGIDVDLKEQNPHYFLQQVNIGYQGFEPHLVRLIAHEGPFGHHTHMNLSRGRMNVPFRHAAEGIAILGEQLGLQAYYKEQPNPALREKDIEEIAAFLHAGRCAGDLINATYERLAFKERLPIPELAKRLGNPLLPAEAVGQLFAGLEHRRDTSFSAGATPYVAGRLSVAAILAAAESRLQALPASEYPKARDRVLRAMYSGQRSTTVMRSHIEMLVNDIIREGVQEQVIAPLESEQQQGAFALS